MVGVSFLVSMVLGWTFGCGLIYALLRWLNVDFSPAIRYVGGLALVMWVLVYVGLASPTLIPPGVNSPYSPKLALGIGMAICGAFGAGSLPLRFLPKRGELWWHDVLFCTLYLGCAHAWGYALLVCWPTKSGLLYDIAQWNGEIGDAHLLMCCVWVFPLGAPLMELLGSNLRRLRREIAQ